MTNRSDEIDLMEVLAKAYRGIKKNISLFISLPLVGMLITVVIFYAREDLYVSNMMITTDLITANESEFIAQELEKDNTIPGLTETEIDHLENLSFKIESTQGDRDVFFTVTAKVTDPKMFPVLEKKIVNYLDSLDPIAHSRKRELLLNKKVIEKIDEQIALMDSFKKQSNGDAIFNSNDPSSLFSRSVDLYRERTERELRMNDIQSVNITQGFASYTKNAGITTPLAGFLGFVGGFLLFVVIMFVRFFNQYNRSLEPS